MERKTATATVTQAYGKTLDKPITFEYGWDAYSNYAEVEAANDNLTNDEVVKVRNEQRKIASRQKTQTEQLTANGIVKPTLENDPQFRLRQMFNTIMANKTHSEEAARKAASDLLGIAWEDEE